MSQVVAELKITLTDDNRISVTGPIENRMLTYGMLELAKDVVKAHDPSRIQLVPPMIFPVGQPT